MIDPKKPYQQVLNIDSTLNANRNVPFVDRIINANKYPVRKNPDGTTSTHLMMQVDNYAVPQLRLVNGQWIDNKNPNDAIKAGDAIKFKSDADALYFTENYKNSKLSTMKRRYQLGGPTPPYLKKLQAQLGYDVSTPEGLSPFQRRGFEADARDQIPVQNHEMINAFKTIDPEFRAGMGTGLKPGVAPGPNGTPRTQINWGKIKNAADSLVPYASNIANLFRRPPKPKLPNMVSAVAITSPKLDKERGDIDRSVRAADVAADRNLDANSAAAVKAANLATGLRAKGDSYTQEGRMNLEAQNQSARLNSSISAINAGKMDEYGNQQTAMRIAQQREQSENLSNAADKYVAEQTRESQNKLEYDKFKIMSRMYGSGVLDRLVRKALGKNDTDTLTDDDYGKVLSIKRTSAYGGKLRYAFGGEIGDPKKKPTQAEIMAATETAQRLAQKSGHMDYMNVHTGGTLPAFVDPAGRPVTGPMPTPNIKVNTFVPDSVKSLEFDPSTNYATYLDPSTGDIQYAPKEYLNLPRFKTKPVENPLGNIATTREYGGLVGPFKYTDKKLKKGDSLPPEMASQYRTDLYSDGGYIGGGLMRRRDNTRKLKRPY